MYIHISDGLGTQKTDFRVESKLNKDFFSYFAKCPGTLSQNQAVFSANCCKLHSHCLSFLTSLILSGLFEDISELCSPPQLQKSFDKYETKTCIKKNKSLVQLTQPENP